MTLGVHFALTESQRDELLAFETDEGRMAYVEEIEEAWEEDNLQETNKAWDAIHRCLTDHPPKLPELESNRGEYPLNLCILGGRPVIDDDLGSIIMLIEADEVRDLANALDSIEKEWMAKKYYTYCNGAWPEYGEEDLGYTWEYFVELREFFRAAATKGLCVIFTVSG